MEFPELEVHCSHPDCNQVDFLPFECDCCHKTFCLEHRSYREHSCPNAGDKDCQAIVCPLCAVGVKLVPGEDPNITWERHCRTGCDTRNYAKIAQKPRCPVAGCKEKLTTSGSVTCKQCGTKVCLAHRFPDDHKCGTLRQTDSWKGFNSAMDSLGSRFMQGLSTRQSTTGSSGGRPSASNQSSGVAPRPAPAASRASREQQLAAQQARAAQQRTPQPSAPINRPAPAPQQSATASEVCPHCQTGFTNVEDLIRHVETFHSSIGGGAIELPPSTQPRASHPAQPRNPPSGGATRAPPPPRATPMTSDGSIRNPAASSNRRSTGGGDPGMACPHCRVQFNDPVQLVAHVEAYHSTGTPANQAIPRQPARSAPRGAGSGGRREVCPECGKSFADLETLIAHAESAHNKNSSNCILS
mmetsp:Transcript_36168/g.43636  ORF Transcript_36168/g.43636 Transcript_36168/m.43636 type:complete len:413 (-) Transcript_36168:155-1393(-)|eukprot:CAMPEP_0197851526 /NCGR_PEP_ID=MMETSP1438-20131217/18272_1 /TAXON_ID=1461541 /ORGANISM="Pterosperma sp., Strain CCMP1384" /LENGTH=412 /DNA_ID=CAMNT_0043465149 /DNA_START=108 /DNA_END=1346 /DNA_ORIENTATION=+